MSSRSLVPYEYSDDDIGYRSRYRCKIGCFNKIYTPYIEHGYLTGLGTLTFTTSTSVDNNSISILAKNTGSTLNFELVSLYIETKRSVGSLVYTSEWTHNNWLEEAPTYNKIESTITSSNRTVFSFLCADQSWWLGKVHLVFRASYGSAPNLRYTYYSVWWD